MTLKTTNLAVKHDQENRLFYVNLQKGQATLKYKQWDEDVMDLKETYVPKEFREKGIGTALVEYVLEYAKRKNNEIIPSCPFVKSFIDDNPSYNELIRE